MCLAGAIPTAASMLASSEMLLSSNPHAIVGVVLFAGVAVVQGGSGYTVQLGMRKYSHEAWHYAMKILHNRFGWAVFATALVNVVLGLLWYNQLSAPSYAPQLVNALAAWLVLIGCIFAVMEAWHRFPHKFAAFMPNPSTAGSVQASQPLASVVPASLRALPGGAASARIPSTRRQLPEYSWVAFNGHVALGSLWCVAVAAAALRDIQT